MSFFRALASGMSGLVDVGAGVGNSTNRLAGVDVCPPSELAMSRKLVSSMELRLSLKEPSSGASLEDLECIPLPGPNRGASLEDLECPP